MITFKLSSMQYGQYQTVNRQFWSNFAPIFVHPEWGTIWVANFVQSCLFFVFFNRQKSRQILLYSLLLCVLTYI